MSKAAKTITVNRKDFCQAVLDLNAYPAYTGEKLTVEGVKDGDLIDSFLNAVDTIPKTKEVDKTIPKTVSGLYNSIVDVVDDGGSAVFEQANSGNGGGTPAKAEGKKETPKKAEPAKKAEPKPPAKPAAKPAAKKEAAPAKAEPKKVEAKKPEPVKKETPKKTEPAKKAVDQGGKPIEGPAKKATDGKKKEVKAKQSLNKFGHQVGTMSDAIDRELFKGTSREKAVKMLMDKFGRTNDLADRKFRDHAAYLTRVKGIKVIINADKGTYKIEANPQQ